MTNSLNLSTVGVGSGLNDTSLIAALVSVKQAPLTAMQTKQTNIQNASQTISNFSSQLSALQTATLALSDPTQYASYTAGSSDPSIVASASSTASPGSYSVVVTTLAKAQLTYGDPQTSSTAALGKSGTLNITVGSNTVGVPIGAGDSLATIASNITAAGVGVSAAVVFDGTTYRLQVQGNATGAANAATFGESGFSLGLSTPANTYQAAQNATGTINNIPITSSTNQISGAIPGVTLALTNVTAAPATITVASNPSAISQKVSAFVSAYNAVVTAGHAAAGYGTTAPSSTLLTADRGIESALGQMSNLVSANVPGADSTLQNLASIGITLANNGTLTLDSTKLSQSLASDPSGVERLFVTDPTTGSTGVMGTFTTTLKALVTNSNSPIKSEIQAFTNQVQELTKQQAALQVRITQYQKQLQAQFAAMEQVVQTQKVNFQNLGGTGTFV